MSSSRRPIEAARRARRSPGTIICTCEDHGRASSRARRCSIEQVTPSCSGLARLVTAIVQRSARTARSVKRSQAARLFGMRTSRRAARAPADTRRACGERSTLAASRRPARPARRRGLAVGQSPSTSRSGSYVRMAAGRVLAIVQRGRRSAAVRPALDGAQRVHLSALACLGWPRASRPWTAPNRPRPPEPSSHLSTPAPRCVASMLARGGFVGDAYACSATAGDISVATRRVTRRRVAVRNARQRLVQQIGLCRPRADWRLPGMTPRMTSRTALRSPVKTFAASLSSRPKTGAQSLRGDHASRQNTPGVRIRRKLPPRREHFVAGSSGRVPAAVGDSRFRDRSADSESCRPLVLLMRVIIGGQRIRCRRSRSRPLRTSLARDPATSASVGIAQGWRARRHRREHVWPPAEAEHVAGLLLLIFQGRSSLCPPDLWRPA